MLKSSVTSTATTTGSAIAPSALGAIVRPNQKKKIAANVSRRGTISRSTRGPIPVPATTIPASSAPIASEAPTVCANPATKTPKPTSRIVVSSASPAEMIGRITRPPQRARANRPRRNANAVAIEPRISAVPSWWPRIGCSSAR